MQCDLNKLKIMKQLLLLTSFILLINCDDDENIESMVDPIFGNWVLVEVYFGLPTSDWVVATSQHNYLIKQDYSFESNRFTTCTTGAVKKDSVILTFTYNCEENSNSYEYSYEFRNDTLQLIPLFLTCDEGCGERYIMID